MKKSIVKRISLSSVLVVIISLIIFSFFTILLYKQSMQKNINQQLVVENRIAYNLLLVDKLDEPAVYKFLSESQNLVYTKRDGEDHFTLIHATSEGFDDIDIEKVVKHYIDKGKKVIDYELEGTRYLMTISTNKSDKKNADSIIVSFISTEDMYELMNRFVWIMIMIAFILSCLSIVIFSILAKRITEPILKVIEVTKEYENRNFEPTYLATTQDEIQELSSSVNKMAQSLQHYDIEKEKLFRTISHEIKTPLTAIYGYAEGMKNGLFKDFDKPLTVIMDESMRIKTMTEDYIFLSKLESKIEIFKFEDCDLSQLLEKAIDTIESIAIMKDIEIDYQPLNLANIQVDSDKIYRCFLNLLTNELKYTKDSIRIRLENLENQILIRIEDNGSGLSKEAIENFNQGLTSEKNNGSGVGLFIINAIILKHGGSFTFGNLNNNGAYFEIILKRQTE